MDQVTLEIIGGAVLFGLLILFGTVIFVVSGSSSSRFTGLLTWKRAAIAAAVICGGCVILAILYHLSTSTGSNSVPAPAVADHPKSYLPEVIAGILLASALLAWLFGGRPVRIALVVIVLLAIGIGEGFRLPIEWGVFPSDWGHQPLPRDVGLWVDNNLVAFALIFGGVMLILNIPSLLAGFFPSLKPWEKSGDNPKKVAYGIAGVMVLLGLWVYFTSPSPTSDPRVSQVLASNFSSSKDWKSVQMTDAGGDSIILPYYVDIRSRPVVHCNGCEVVCVYVNPKKAPDVILEDTAALCPNNGVTVDHVVARDTTGKPGNEAKYAYVPM